MKWIVWTIGGLLAALWTGALALAVLAVDWMGGALQRVGSAGAPAPSLPAELPAWLTGWFEPASWAFVVQASQEALGAVQSVLPAVGTATGWLEPLVWVLWALGMIALLVVAAGSHWLVGRRATVRVASLPSASSDSF
jgi:hypothetical protein